jgi:hypothetical protein
MVLYSYAGAADMWDANASAHDSKFGIYRSLNNRAMLRDEQVRFADFCASKQSAADCEDGAVPVSDAGAGGGEMDAGAAVDAGTGTGGATGEGGSNGSGGETGSGGSTASGGSTGSGGAGGSDGSGGSTPKPPASDAGTSRDMRPAPEPGSGEPAACSCSLGARTGGGGGGGFIGLLLFAVGCAVMRRRAR